MRTTRYTQCVCSYVKPTLNILLNRKYLLRVTFFSSFSGFREPGRNDPKMTLEGEKRKHFSFNSEHKLISCHMTLTIISIKTISCVVASAILAHLYCLQQVIALSS